MNPTEKHNGSQHVLYDADQISHMDAQFFNPETLAQQGLLRGQAQGRGTTHFIELYGRPCVLRHYRRGGWAAKLFGDRYWRATLPETRAWREWHLLADLAEQGLPVPRPVAARVVTDGMFYRADLITQHLEQTQPLSQTLIKKPLSKELWRIIGQCIRRFHDAGVYHADLNAHNILLGAEGVKSGTEGPVYLIDFDKGEIRSPEQGWQEANLARLRRSLDKLKGLSKAFCFAESDWVCLKEGWDKRD